MFKKDLSGCFLQIGGVYYLAMASADRPRGTLIEFNAGITYGKVYAEGSANNSGDLATRLRREIDKAQVRNGSWAEERLKDLRVESGESLLDVLIAGEDGQVLNAVSTYRAYAMNAHLALTIPDLAAYAKENEMFVYPLTGERDTMLFWHQDYDQPILPVIEARFGSVNVENYTVRGNESDVSVARIQGGLMGSGRFADANVIYGRLGFWENRKLALGVHGAKIYIERARFKETDLLGCETYVSPLDRDQVLERGGVPMDSKQFAVDVVRVDTSETNGDFIVSALQGTLQFPYPVVLGYSPLRPWKGEIPKHG